MFSFGFLKTEAFDNAFSILLGIALVSLFKATCKGDECRVLKAPRLDEVTQATYQLGEQCYQFRTELTACPSNGVIEPFGSKRLLPL
jgi:hypothetical protein